MLPRVILIFNSRVRVLLNMSVVLLVCINNRKPVVTDIPEECVNKDDNVNSASMYINKQLCFDHTLDFVAQPSSIFIASYISPLDMQDSQAYLSLVSDVLSSGVPNYRSIRAPLPSFFFHYSRSVLW